jgi:hypothetical protein
MSTYVVVVASTTKVVDETAQALGPCNAPLAQALQSLERIVTMVDGIADVRSLRLCFVIALLKLACNLGSPYLQGCVDGAVFRIQGEHI